MKHKGGEKACHLQSKKYDTPRKLQVLSFFKKAIFQGKKGFMLGCTVIQQTLHNWGLKSQRLAECLGDLYPQGLRFG